MIGILGGTFDPVHNAHLAMAGAALRELGLDEILWIPTGAPGYRHAPIASAEHRLAMLKLALAGEPHYRIDIRELAPGASGYTVDTLKSLRSEIGSQALQRVDRVPGSARGKLADEEPALRDRIGRFPLPA